MTVLRFVGWTALVAIAAAAVVVLRPDMADNLSPEAGAYARGARARVPQPVAGWLGLDKPPARADAPSQGPRAGAGQQRPPVSVVLAQATRKAAPVRFDAIGTVQPAASVVIRPRVDSQIVEVLVADGASVKAGDVLARLDSRQIEAQIRQAEAQLEKDRAALDQAKRDTARLAELIGRGATTQLALDNAKTAVAAQTAVADADRAALDNLRVQLGYYTIKAPISGRLGVVGLKVGAIARQGEAAGAFGTINQVSPIYVAFSLPQRLLPELRDAMQAGEAKAVATPQGAKSSAEGKVSVLDNAIDTATGTITARAVFDNADELLWPGQFCNVRVVLRTEPNAIVVPRVAVQTGQQGSFVFVAENDQARIRNVVLARIQDDEAIIAEGLKPGEMVVVDGQSMLFPNARIVVRAPAAPGGKDGRQPPQAAREEPKAGNGEQPKSAGGDVPVRSGAAGPAEAPARAGERRKGSGAADQADGAKRS